MKLTLRQIQNAAVGLQEFLEAYLPPKKAWQLYQLSKLLNEQNEFFITQQRRILEQYKAEAQPNGYVKFTSPEVSMQAQKDLNELANLEIELDIYPVSLTDEDTKDLRISIATAAALDGLIDFN